MQLLSTARQMPGKKNQEMKRQTESSMVVARGWEAEGAGSCCSMGAEVPVAETKKFRTWTVVMATVMTVNVRNATDRDTLKKW